jgi:hypothetical protein
MSDSAGAGLCPLGCPAVTSDPAFYGPTVHLSLRTTPVPPSAPMAGSFQGFHCRMGACLGHARYVPDLWGLAVLVKLGFFL